MPNKGVASSAAARELHVLRVVLVFAGSKERSGIT